MPRKKNCFVIIGFGPKVDFETGRILNLDKTFTKLIEPVFTELNINCFRAKEIRHTGIIDLPMYEWIYKADIVVADISTLNPNAIYELGIRHALRPFTTIVISENQLKYPFDLNHILIEKYKHLGNNIAAYEARRFKKELKSKVKAVLKNKKKDSPVYTFLSNLKPPTFTSKEIKSIKKRTKVDPLFSELLSDAESAKNRNDFIIALELFKVCLKFDPNNVFLKQRLALVTYKSQKPNAKKALLNAQEILNDLNPKETNDPETLGLMGSINKRLFELTKRLPYLEESLFYYQKGYYLQNDYYNGINYAYLLNLKAVIERKKNNAISFFVQANKLREQIIISCQNLIKDKTFKYRGDKIWVYQSLAQAFYANGKTKEVNKLVSKIESFSHGDFDKNTFSEQNKKLKENIRLIRSKYKIR